ncbi:hypothetical protein JRQ81_013220 [Phrynocephalus forsythii]|uniref:Uncharacterized protein n=1 Tax=Phrynocephalus forsythii TaxID=171643 RepID=A0A9Q1B4R2_9SAUR|nr:hypothetical protein JRQ81_013220 [Phrynocephalus forsythii]
MEHISVSGNTTYADRPKQRRDQLGSEIEQTVLIDYTLGIKGYEVTKWKTGEISMRYVDNFEEQSKGAKEIVFICSEEKGQYVEPLFNRAVPKVS